MKSIVLSALALAAFTSPVLAQTNAAFPGAEGFGRFAAGGRGGETVHVTTLEDAGPGSFRDAVSQPHRIIVFDVGGIIRLKSNLAASSQLTIQGQTAPGEGITLYGRSVSFSGQQDVIVREVRFREGINGDKGKCAINLVDGSNMIFDHCSIEWGRWDCLGLTHGSHDITFQYCLIGEGVDPQRFGSLSDTVTNITYSHNLWINNQSRNPKAKGRIQYINNVVYNWGVCGLVGGHSEADHYLDALGNYFIAGPNSNARAVGEFKATDHVCQKDNWADLDKDGQLNGRELVAADFGAGENAPTLTNTFTVAPLAGVTVEPAAAALTNVLAGAGCSRQRDAVDARLIAAVRSWGTQGKIIHSEAEVGGIDGQATPAIGLAPELKPQAEDDKSAILPGRHMSEHQVVELASQALPQAAAFSCEFKGGVWEIWEPQHGDLRVSSITTNAAGQVFVQSTNAMRLVLKVRDADGAVEPVKAP